VHKERRILSQQGGEHPDAQGRARARLGKPPPPLRGRATGCRTGAWTLKKRVVKYCLASKPKCLSNILRSGESGSEGVTRHVALDGQTHLQRSNSL
jgi:hypothetical protein